MFWSPGGRQERDVWVTNGSVYVKQESRVLVTWRLPLELRSGGAQRAVVVQPGEHRRARAHLQEGGAAKERLGCAGAGEASEGRGDGLGRRAPPSPPAPVWGMRA